MNAATILMIIEIIKLIQAMQTNDSTVKDKLVDTLVEGSDSEKEVVKEELATLDLSFVAELIEGIFGKKN